MAAWAHRALMLALMLWGAAWAAPGTKPPAVGAAPLRLGIPPAIVHDRYDLIEDWRAYMQRHLARPVEFIACNGYSETLNLLRQRRVDVAWISSGAYVFLARSASVRLLVTPIYRGRPYYRAYLIVPATDRETASLAQLKGKVFAYGDMDSLAGYRLPRFELRQAGKDADNFFRRSFVTGSSRHVFEAVADGLADAGSVSSFIWDTLAVVKPGLVGAVRIAAKSPEYAFPPLVVQPGMDRAEAHALQRVLMQMATDPEGAALLKRLNIDGFVAGDPRLYDSVASTMRALGLL